MYCKYIDTATISVLLSVSRGPFGVEVRILSDFRLPGLTTRVYFGCWVSLLTGTNGWERTDQERLITDERVTLLPRLGILQVRNTVPSSGQKSRKHTPPDHKLDPPSPGNRPTEQWNESKKKKKKEKRLLRSGGVGSYTGTRIKEDQHCVFGPKSIWFLVLKM